MLFCSIAIHGYCYELNRIASSAQALVEHILYKPLKAFLKAFDGHMCPILGALVFLFDSLSRPPA